MARDLTNPVVNPDTTVQAVTKIEFLFFHKDDEVDGFKIDRDTTYLEFTVDSFDADLNRIGRTYRRENLNAWPQLLKDEVKAVYSRIENYAETLGIMAPGVSEEL